MANPIIANRVPRHGTQSGVAEIPRASLRASDAEIVRSSIDMFMGSGPAYYEAASGVLPEKNESIAFQLVAWSGSPSAQAALSLSSGRLVIDRSVAANQRGIFKFGELQAPADPTDPLMLEFTLMANLGDIVQDGDDWSGVMAGFKINSTGLVVKFLYDGVDLKIGLFDAAVSSTVPVTSVIYNWCDGLDHTYKLLWWTSTDVVRLYVSEGDGPVSDTILLSSTVSAFPGPLAPNEIPVNQPQVFFGHGGYSAQSISYWTSIYFYNEVSSPIMGGIFRGEHTGFIQTDEMVKYLPTKRPSAADQPWLPLPASFGTIGGSDEVTVSGELVLYRADKSSSYGYFRYEPKVATKVTVLDFDFYGELTDRNFDVGDATGMEVYIDDGVKKVVVGFLDSGSQAIGILTGLEPHKISSYTSITTGWSARRTYRLIYDPSSGAKLYQLIETDEGINEHFLLEVPYAGLPASDYPGPGLGFLHNANIIAALATMKITRIRYSMDERLLNGDQVTPGTWTPPAPWTQLGTGSSTSDGLIAKLINALGSPLGYSHPELDIDADNGFVLEIRGRVNSYTVGSELDPIREVTGAAFGVADGTNVLGLFFADAGPQLGKIVSLYLASSDPTETLLAIRSNDPTTDGVFASIDWTEFHLYRLEKTIGGKIRLYIDESATPVIELDERSFSGPTMVASPYVFFGNMSSDRVTESEWELLRYTFSTGFDIAASPLLSENEILSRFKHSINVIVHAEESV